MSASLTSGEGASVAGRPRLVAVDPAQRVLAAVRAAAASCSIVAATALPWATFRVVATGATTTFMGGPLSVALVVLGIATLLLCGARFVLRWPRIDVVQMAVAVATGLDTVALALTKIGAANDVVASGPSATSYAAGSAVGVVAAGIIGFASTLSLLFATLDRHGAPLAG